MGSHYQKLYGTGGVICDSKSRCVAGVERRALRPARSEVNCSRYDRNTATQESLARHYPGDDRHTTGSTLWLGRVRQAYSHQMLYERSQRQIEPQVFAPDSLGEKESGGVLPAIYGQRMR